MVASNSAVSVINYSLGISSTPSWLSKLTQTESTGSILILSGRIMIGQARRFLLVVSVSANTFVSGKDAHIFHNNCMKSSRIWAVAGEIKTVKRAIICFSKVVAWSRGMGNYLREDESFIVSEEN